MLLKKIFIVIVSFFNFRLNTNLPKNRYNNILAFEETRVHLQELEDDPVGLAFFICYSIFDWSLALVINISCAIWDALYTLL